MLSLSPIVITLPLLILLDIFHTRVEESVFPCDKELELDLEIA